MDKKAKAEEKRARRVKRKAGGGGSYLQEPPEPLDVEPHSSDTTD